MCLSNIDRITFFLLVVASPLTACKKLDKKHPVEFTIHAFMPHDGTPVMGVKYSIVEMKAKKGILAGEEETGRRIEGITDGNGYAAVSLIIRKNKDYNYYIYFDYSHMYLPGYPDVTVKGTSFDQIETSGNQEDYEIRVLPRCYMTLRLENVNCFDENDKMRYRRINTDENPNSSIDNYSFTNNYFEGCGITYANNDATQTLAGKNIYKMEITRNGQISIQYDTIHLAPNITNDVLIGY